jgi:hypothetical protein
MSDDGLLRLIGRMPMATPDPTRDQLVRRRCRTLLVQPRGPSRTRVRWWPPLVALSALYILEVVHQGIRLYLRGS